MMLQWSSAITLPAADAGRRNMLLLILLRWIAVSGQLITIAVADRLLGIRLPLAPLLVAPALLAAINLVSLPYLRRRSGGVSNSEVTAALLIDVAALAWQLYHSGGLANPFASLFLLQVVIGAMLLEPRSSWGIVAAALIGLGILTLDPEPLVLSTRYASDPMQLYLAGSLVCFVLIAILLVAFVSRISRNLREADAALATIRQHAAEEHHIVRMGLLASGAAHELGTPLSTIAVIIGDLARHPALLADEGAQTDLSDVQTELERCKMIVGDILTAAGEVRGENPAITTVKTFLEEIEEDWRGRAAGRVRLRDDFGEDMIVVSDPALRQVVCNVIENGLESAPTEVVIHAQCIDRALVLDITDDGPGFTADMLKDFGRPYATTKSRTGGGLGLFLVVNVLRKLNGEVEVSNPPEGGALVRLKVPLASLAYSPDAAA